MLIKRLLLKWSNIICLKKCFVAPALPEKCIKLSGIKKGSVVYDPFVGTGTTVVEAIKLGMIGIGTDVSNEFISFAKKRVANDELLNPTKNIKPKIKSKKIKISKKQMTFSID